VATTKQKLIVYKYKIRRKESKHTTANKTKQNKNPSNYKDKREN
jgi:hypothetical protein